MKPRCAAALALVGWYLMIPPVDDSKKPRAEVPLAEWKQIQSFDTSTACEEWKSSAQDKNIKTLDSDTSTDMERKDAKAAFAIWWDSRCIATDDPRL